MQHQVQSATPTVTLAQHWKSDRAHIQPMVNKEYEGVEQNRFWLVREQSEETEKRPVETGNWRVTTLAAIQ